MTQEPLYPEGHPKRIDQDSQGINADTPSHPKEKKKDDRNPARQFTKYCHT